MIDIGPNITSAIKAVVTGICVCVVLWLLLRNV